MTALRTSIRSVLISVILGVAASAGVTTRISVDQNGNEPNLDSEGVISANGKYLVLFSGASNLVPDDTNQRDDIFWKDLSTGRVVRVNVDSQGHQSDGYCLQQPSISADGMVVAFGSNASDLVPGDTNGVFDVFVHDLRTGITSLVSTDSHGVPGDRSSCPGVLSADGRTVAFCSNATNLVAGDTNGWQDVFVHDLATGETVHVSVSSTGQQGDLSSELPSISRDGRVVAFESSADNLAPMAIPAPAVYVHDRRTGATTLASVNSRGMPGNMASGGCALSEDGNVVAFLSNATNLDDDIQNDFVNVFVHDRVTGSTRMVSLDRDGRRFHYIGIATPWMPRISGDGRFVIYQVGDLYERTSIYMTEVATRLTSLVSVSSDGDFGRGDARSVSVSRDGRLCAFASRSKNLVHGKTTPYLDEFLHRPASLQLSGTPTASSPVSFVIDAAEPHDLALVLLSASGTSGFRLAAGPELLLDRGAGMEDIGAPMARWIPLGLDALTLAGLQALPLLTARADADGNAMTPTFLFPSVAAGTTFFAAAITVDGAGAIESVTSAIAIVTQ